MTRRLTDDLSTQQPCYNVRGKAVSIHALREVAHVGKRNAQAYLDALARDG